MPLLESINEISGTRVLYVYIPWLLCSCIVFSDIWPAVVETLPLFWKPTVHGVYLWLEVHFGAGEGKVDISASILFWNSSLPVYEP